MCRYVMYMYFSLLAFRSACREYKSSTTSLPEATTRVVSDSRTRKFPSMELCCTDCCETEGLIGRNLKCKTTSDTPFRFDSLTRYSPSFGDPLCLSLFSLHVVLSLLFHSHFQLPKKNYLFGETPRINIYSISIYISIDLSKHLFKFIKMLI